MIEESALTLEEMQTDANKDKIFKLIWVQDLFVSNNKMLFLFKHDVQGGEYLPLKLDPERLFTYVPGAFYKRGQRLPNLKEDGEELGIRFTSKDRNVIKKAKQVFGKDLYDLNYGWVSHNEAQFCVVIESEELDIIFPCFVIAPVYYFTSASMRKQLFAQNLEGLYEAKSIEVDPDARTAKIYLNPNAYDDDAADIIRFDRKKHAKNHWDYIVNSFRTYKDAGRKAEVKYRVPFIADFPIAEEITMKIRGVKKEYWEGKKKKTKILVLEILWENSSFDFDKITIKRLGVEPRTIDVTKRVKARSTSRIVTHRIPTTALAKVEILNSELLKNLNKREMEVEKEYVDMREGGTAVPVVQGDGEADISFTESEHDGDAGVRHGDIKSPPLGEELAKYKEDTSLKDFQEMVTPLENSTGITGFLFHGPYYLPEKKKEGTKKSFLAYFDKENNERRQYMYVTFTYKSSEAAPLRVCLIEVDQNNLPRKTATHILVSSHEDQITSVETATFAKMFAERNKIEDIEHYFIGKGFKFDAKSHPEKKDEKEYERWRKLLLNKLDLLATKG